MARDPFQLVGTTIDGKYRIDRVLGEGGCGVVYLAWHAMLGQPVALKCLKPMGGAIDDEKQLTELFLREARVLFSLGHPNIVRLYDVGTIATSMYAVPYVVLEYIDGPTLDEEIARRAHAGGPGPFTAVELLAIFTPVLEAVSYAHAAGIAHRDLKPSNVMLARASRGAGPTAKVVDFGIARRLGDPKHSTSATGFTPRYAAPEQWDGASFGPVSGATDVFALGLMIAEACTLRPVLEATGPAAILSSLVDPDRRVRVSDRRPDLPPALDEVVERATRLRATDRYRTASELLDALHAALDPRSSRPFVEAPTEYVSQGPRFVSAPPPPPSGPTGPGMASARGPRPLAAMVAYPSSPASPASTGSPASITTPTAPGAGRGVVAALAAVAVALAALAGVLAWVFVSRSSASSIASASSPASSGEGVERDPTKEPVSSPRKPKPAAATKSADDEFDELMNESLRQALKPPTAPTTRKRPAKDGPSVEITHVLGGEAPNNEEKILAVVDANLKDVKGCYTKALTRDPMLQGEITLMLSVDAKGAVSGAMCAEDGKSITDAPLRTCVSSKATAWRFAKPKDATVGFMVTLDFSP